MKIMKINDTICGDPDRSPKISSRFEKDGWRTFAALPSQGLGSPNGGKVGHQARNPAVFLFSKRFRSDD
jgi:hypothetical protein